MIDNAVKFFDRYKSDEALRRRVAEATEAYPGSLEIREALVEAVLLPIAAELGLDFSVEELRAYETRRKMSRLTETDEEYFARIDSEESFWLLDNGWEYDDEVLRAGEERRK